ncbi:hypothetical protein Tco_0165725 [Tanacetum coccineum]
MENYRGKRITMGKVGQCGEVKKRSIWEISTASKASWGWKNLLASRAKVKSFVKYEIGDGQITFVWHDQWFCERFSAPILDDAANDGVIWLSNPGRYETK